MIGIPVLAVLWLGAGNAAPQAAQSEQVNVTALASGALEQARQARASLAAGNRDAASRSVDQGLAMTRRAENLLRPSTPAGTPILVPLETEVEVETTFKPRRAGVETTARAERTVGAVSGRSLDVGMARQQFEAARAALDRDDPTAADNSLAAVENSVRTEAASGDLPLVRARQNLEVARSRALDGKPNAARAPLREAARALREYEAGAPGPQAAEAAALRADIEDYAGQVRRDRDGAPARIGAFISRLGSFPGAPR